MSDYYDDKLSSEDSLKNFFLRVITGTCVFITGYLLVISIFQIVTLIIYNYFFVVVNSNYNIIDDIPQEYTFWNLKRVLFINIFGPLIMLIMAILSKSIYNNFSGIVSVAKYYFLWMYILFVNYFLSLLISSPFGVENYNNGLYQGLNVIFAWMRMKSIIISPIAIIATLLLIIFGYNIGGMFLKFSFSFSNNNIKKGRNYFILQSFLMPIIIGLPIVMLLTTSYSFLLNVFLFLGLLLISLGVYLRNEYVIIPEKAFKGDVLNKIPFIEFIIALLLWCIIYFFWS